MALDRPLHCGGSFAPSFACSEALMPETLPAGTSALSEADADLARLILDRGILRSTPGAPVLGRDGVRAEWMLYTLPVTLSADGGAAAAAAMLPVLRTFEARQVVSVGYTAIPL